MTYRILKTSRFKNLYSWSVLNATPAELNFSDKYNRVKIGSLLRKSKNTIIINDDKTYKRVTVKLYGGGVKLRDEVLGKEIKTKRQFVLKEGQFLYSRIDARNGAFGLAGKDVDNAIVSNEFPIYDVDASLVIPEFLVLITSSKPFYDFCQSLSSGSTGRQRIDESSFLSFKVPLPDISIQTRIVEQHKHNITTAQEAENEANELEKQIENYLFSELGIEKPKTVEKKEGLQFVRFKNINLWSIDKIFYSDENGFKNSQKLSNNSVINVFRGKSPKYEENGKAIILNQKCNRLNEIKLEFAKTVNKDWFNSINEKFKTSENDILINSTGDGTIGRSSLVTKDFENLIYDSHILLLRLNQEVINPTFFVYQFNSTFIQNQIEQIKSSQSTKQTELGLENLFKLNFSIPQRIYDKNDKIDIEKDIQIKIANHITAIKEKIKSLRQQTEDLRKQAKETFENEIFA